MNATPKHAAEAPGLPDQPFEFAVTFLRYYWLAFTVMFLAETGQATCQIMIPYAVKELIDTPVHMAASGASGSISAQTAALWPSLKLFVWLSIGTIGFSRLS